MRLATQTGLLLAASSLRETLALPKSHLDASINTVVGAGTFSNPSVNARPKFRYWLPDASVDPSLVAADIEGIGDVGAGGIELLNYYMYGGEDGNASTDWDIYGFGTPAYNEILKAAAQATKDHGLIMDFCMGPESGQGAPAEPDNPGLSYELISFNATVEPGGTFNGEVPGWGSGTLVSITTAMIVNVSQFDRRYAQSKPRRDYLAIIPPGPNPTSFIKNGSFAVDHFSPNGAQVMTDFLEQFILINGVKELFMEIVLGSSWNMLQIVPLVDALETEHVSKVLILSLGFQDDIDRYRQYVGPAHLAEKRIISCELGAVILEVYELTLRSLLRLTNRAFAAGINMIVFHGSPFSYNYPNTTWPGFTSFDYNFAEMHSRHQPAWEHGYREFMDAVARTQFIQQSGTPKIDLAFWDKPTSSAVRSDNLTELTSAGYTYEYLSPENFQLPQAIVSNGVLSPSGSAYKALVLEQGNILTNTTGEAYVASTPSSIIPLSNVHQIANGSLLVTLGAIGIQPATKVSANSVWYTTWRQTPDGTNYFLVYNDGNSSAGTASFASVGTPFYFDIWTGVISPVLEYAITSGYTTISLKLASGQTVLVAFTSNAQQWAEYIPSLHVSSASVPVLSYNYSKSTGLIAKVQATTSTFTLTTSDSVQYTLNSNGTPAAFNLGNWTLVAESWDPPADLSDANTLGVRTNKTHQLPILLPWTQILELANKSGIGYYSTSFNWRSSTKDYGAIIDFGPVVQSLSVSINGHQLPPVDLTSAKADITSYLVQGENLVEAVAATTLANVLRTIWDELLISGSGPVLPAWVRLPQDEGLLGTVVVTPYKAVKVVS
ncbi:uncharacterized protein PAC_11643 [Phialocephala subalpina]|uniref:Secreted protein n=1 Tax=Phialocephala subalpina TaxID=576137 RepID=A0A1L7X9S4_9HELO|nr:uncharacterized protein PAC_11643 [Phialocephala subalpina]